MLFRPYFHFFLSLQMQKQLPFFRKGRGKRTIKNRIPRLESFWYTYAPISYQKLSKYVSMSPNNARIPFQTEIRWQSQISPPTANYEILSSAYPALTRYTRGMSQLKSQLSRVIFDQPPFSLFENPFLITSSFLPRRLW